MGLFQRKYSSLRENKSRYADRKGPIGRYISSPVEFRSGQPFSRPSTSSTRLEEPLLGRKNYRKVSSSSARTSKMPSNSSNYSSLSINTSQGTFSSEASSTKHCIGARYKERLHPGKEISLGKLGTYHRNPKGLGALYDWEAEEGGYIPFQHQKAHRKKWRQEMEDGERADERHRLARQNSVEEKKAARRREYDAYLASKRRV